MKRLLFICSLLITAVCVRAQTVGIHIAAPLVKNNPIDNTITGYANLLNGGYHIGPTYHSRDSLNLVFNRTLYPGTIFYVSGVDSTYRWSGSAWVVASGQVSSNIYNSDGSLVSNRTLNLNNNILTFVNTDDSGNVLAAIMQPGYIIDLDNQNSNGTNKGELQLFNNSAKLAGSSGGIGTSLTLSSSAFFQDDSDVGLLYAGTYNSTDPHWLPPLRVVDSLIAAASVGTGYTFNNGITNTSGVVKLGGLLTGATVIGTGTTNALIIGNTAAGKYFIVDPTVSISMDYKGVTGKTSFFQVTDGISEMNATDGLGITQTDLSLGVDTTFFTDSKHHIGIQYRDSTYIPPTTNSGNWLPPLAYIKQHFSSGASGISSLTGDGTATGPGSVPFTLATVNSTPGSYGTASAVPGITVNAKGLVTGSVSTAIQIAESQVTNLITDITSKANNSTTVTLEGVSQALSGPPVFNSPQKYEVGTGKQYSTIAAALTAAPAKNFTIYVYGTVVGPFTVTGKDSLAIEGVGEAMIIDNNTVTEDAVTIGVATGTADSVRIKLSNLVIWRKGKNIIANNSRGMLINKYSTVYASNVQVISDKGDGVYNNGNAYFLKGHSTTRNRIGFINNGVRDSTVAQYCIGTANYEGFSNHSTAILCAGISKGTWNGVTGGGFGNAGLARDCVGKSDSTFGFINHGDMVNGYGYAIHCSGSNLFISAPSGYQIGFSNQSYAENCSGWSSSGTGVQNYSRMQGGAGYSITGTGIGTVADSSATIGATGLSVSSYGITIGKGSLYGSNGYSQTGSALNVTDSLKTIQGGVFYTESTTVSCVKVFYATHFGNGNTFNGVTISGGLNGIQGSSNTHLTLINLNINRYGTYAFSGIINDYVPASDTIKVGLHGSYSDKFNYSIFRNASTGSLVIANNTLTDANTAVDFTVGAAGLVALHVSTSLSSQMGVSVENGTHFNIISGTAFSTSTRIDGTSTGFQASTNGSFTALKLQPSGGNVLLFTGTDDGVNKLQVNGSISTGVTGSSTGVLNIKGSTSGDISITSQAAAGTYNLNLPITLGTAGQVWALGATPSSSAGVWVTPFTNPMTAPGDIIYGGTSGTATRLGTATGLLHAGTTPSWSLVAQSDVTNGFVDLSSAQTIAGNKTLSGVTNFNGTVNLNQNVNFFNGTYTTSLGNSSSGSNQTQIFPNQTGTLADQRVLQPPTTSTITLAYTFDYVFTGTLAATWTLPAISSSIAGDPNKITIYNRGTGVLTINSASGGNDIFKTSAVSTFTLAAGTACTLFPDGTYYLYK